MSTIFLSPYCIKQINSLLSCVCSVMDHRRCQNVVGTLVTDSAIAFWATFLFLPHFDVVSDQLLNGRMTIWNLFVKLTMTESVTVKTSLSKVKSTVFYLKVFICLLISGPYWKPLGNMGSHFCLTWLFFYLSLAGQNRLQLLPIRKW